MRRFVTFVLMLGLAAAGSAVAATIVGTKGPDVLRGTQGADVLNGGAGNDTIYGRAGNDRINGGPGKDRVICGAGVDRVKADKQDVVARDCEVVSRPTVSAPKPSPSPTPTPTPPAPVGSQKNPVPLGQPANVGNGWTVTVTAVYPDATAAVLGANMFNDPPAAGAQFFMIAVTATFSGSGSSHLDSSFSMRALGQAGIVYTTFSNSCGVLPDPEIKTDDPEVFAGGTVTGNAACWAIPSSDASSLVMFYEPFLSGQRTWFALR